MLLVNHLENSSYLSDRIFFTVSTNFVYVYLHLCNVFWKKATEQTKKMELRKIR